MTAPPLVSVLVVNYNGRRHLAPCLEALARQTLPAHAFEVVLVDNASADGSAAFVRERFPWVRLVESRANTGFAGGNNLAARHAHGAWLALLNNDTIPDPFWLEEAVAEAREFPGGWVASKLVFADRPDVLNSAGLTLLRDGRGADRGFREIDAGQYEAGDEVFGGCGAALLLPAPPDGTPLLDERLFLYSEDLDAAWRLRLAGGSCRYAPRSVVRHAHGAAAGDASPLFWFCVERNRALVALKNGDPFLAAYCALTLAAKVPQAWMRVLLRRGGPRARPAVAWAVTRALFGFLAGAPAALVERFDIRSRVAGRARCGW